MWMVNTHVSRTSAIVFHKHKSISNPTFTPVDAVITAFKNLAMALKGKMSHYLH